MSPGGKGAVKKKKTKRVEVKFCWYGKKASVVANRKLKFGRERKKERQETEQRQKNRSASYISH